MALPIAFHGLDIHTKASQLNSSRAEGGKSCDRAVPTRALSSHSSVNANCDKETLFLKDDHVTLCESFPKPKVHVDKIPCHDVLACVFPPEASQVIQVQNESRM